MPKIRVRAVAVDALPGGGVIACVGPPTDLLWMIRADATGAEVAASMDELLLRVAPGYQVPGQYRHVS